MFSDTFVPKMREQLQKFYQSAGREPPFPLDQLEEKLMDLGVADDEGLQSLRWEDLESIGIPKVQARTIKLDILREKETPNAPAQQFVVRSMTDEVGELNNHDLVARFAQNPTALHNAVAEQIRVRSKSRPCIAYLSDGKVDVETSAKALEYIAAGDDFGTTIRIDGKPKYLYRLGEGSGEIRDEHPVFLAQTLRLDKTDHDDVYWGDIPLECRQLIRFAAGTQELKARERSELLDLRDQALRGLPALSERYPKAFLLYEDAKQLGNLPSLRTRVRKTA